MKDKKCVVVGVSGISKVIRGKRKTYKKWQFEKTSEKCVEAIERIIE